MTRWNEYESQRVIEGLGLLLYHSEPARALFEGRVSVQSCSALEVEIEYCIGRLEKKMRREQEAQMSYGYCVH